MEPTEDPPLVSKLRSLLNRSTRIEITDGRVFIGQFMCIDHSKNIILSGTYEYQPPSSKSNNSSNSNCQDLAAIAAAIGSAEPPSNSTSSSSSSTSPSSSTSSSTPKPKPGILKRNNEEEKRFVGQIMIPGHHIVKAEMDCSHLRGSESVLKATPVYDVDYLRG